MKFLIATTLLAASLGLAPAFASEVSNSDRLVQAQTSQAHALFGFGAVDNTKGTQPHAAAAPLGYDPSHGGISSK